MRTIRDKTYKRALDSPEQPWARNIIEAYESERKRIAKFRDENLASRTPAELEFESILKELDVHFVREQTIRRSGHAYFVDFFVKAPFWIGFEVDGRIHERRASYDLKRDITIIGGQFPLVRYLNEDVLERRGTILGDVKKIFINQAAKWSGEKWQRYSKKWRWFPQRLMQGPDSPGLVARSGG